MNLPHCSSPPFFDWSTSPIVLTGPIFLLIPLLLQLVFDTSHCFNWSSTFLTALTGLRHFPLLQLVFNTSHCFNWPSAFLTASTGLQHSTLLQPISSVSNCFKLNSFLTYINSKITCIFINRIISK